MRDGSTVDDSDLKKVLEAVREILAIQSSAIYVPPRQSRLFSSRRVRLRRMADVREIKQWIIINQMGAKPRTSDWQARKDFPFFLNPPFNSRYDWVPFALLKNDIQRATSKRKKGEDGEGGKGARMGEDRVRTGCSRKEKGFLVVLRIWWIAERRQAMPTIWLLCHATCSYTSMQLQRACIKGNENTSVRATSACYR